MKDLYKEKLIVGSLNKRVILLSARESAFSEFPVNYLEAKGKNCVHCLPKQFTEDYFGSYFFHVTV